MAEEKAEVRDLLLKVLEPDDASIVLSYLLSRCTLCEEGKGVLVKDGGGEWQIWCLKCALQQLPDDCPWVSPLHAPHSHSCNPEPGSLVSSEWMLIK